jgi:hypothetical protein
VLSIDQSLVTALEKKEWKAFSGMGRATFSLLGVKPVEEAILMVSTISFIQANLQHSIAASRVLARTVIGKGIDIALIQ